MRFDLLEIPPPFSGTLYRNAHLAAGEIANAYLLVVGVEIVADISISSTGGETYTLMVNDSWITTRQDEITHSQPEDASFILWWQSLSRPRQIANWSLDVYQTFQWQFTGGTDALSNGAPRAGSIRIEGLFRDVGGTATLVGPSGPRLIQGDSDALFKVTLGFDNSSWGSFGYPAATISWDDPADMPEVPSSELWRADDALAKSTPFTSSQADPDNADVTWSINNLEVHFIH